MRGDMETTARSTPGERRASKGERTRRRIVGHATMLIYANGYARTTIDDVIRAAGVTKGSFYFHFKSKEELGRTVIENASSHILGRLREALGRRDLSPSGRVEAMLREVQSIVEAADCSRGCILGNLALETSNSHPAFREAIAGAFRDWSRLIAGESGARRIEEFDVSDLSCQIACFVPRGSLADGKFNPDDWMEPHEQRDRKSVV